MAGWHVCCMCLVSEKDRKEEKHVGQAGKEGAGQKELNSLLACHCLTVFLGIS